MRRCDVSMDGFFFAVASSIAFATASCDLMVKLLKFMMLVVLLLVVRYPLQVIRNSVSSCQIVWQ